MPVDALDATSREPERLRRFNKSGACASRYPSLSCPLARLVRAAPLPDGRRDDMPTMTYPTTASEQTYIEVTGGVDTHKDTHTAAALDASGRLLGHREFAATAAGYAALLAWLGTLGQLVRVGVEGTGVYGAGLARFLQAAGVELVEVDRPDRKTRRWQGKSDPVDAEAAARAAQAGRASGVPKTRGGKVDALRALRVARRSAVRPAPMPSARSRR